TTDVDTATVLNWDDAIIRLDRNVTVTTADNVLVFHTAPALTETRHFAFGPCDLVASMMHVAGPCGGRVTRDRRQLADRKQRRARFGDSPMIIVGSDRKTAVRIENLLLRHSPVVSAAKVPMRAQVAAAR